VYVENRLFATLDATTRRVFLTEDHHCLITDTVGFIRKLPHQLVASFRSTLEEVNDADMLIHVVDISNHLYDEQLETVNKVLGELKANMASVIIAFNKVDLVQDETFLNQLSRHYPEAMFISAHRKIGLQKIKTRILEQIQAEYGDHVVTIPSECSEMLTTIRHLAEIKEISETDHSLVIRYRSRKDESDQITAYVEKQKLLFKLQK
jgi:GTP-binding protein HflX